MTLFASIQAWDQYHAVSHKLIADGVYGAKLKRG